MDGKSIRDAEYKGCGQSLDDLSLSTREISELEVARKIYPRKNHSDALPLSCPGCMFPIIAREGNAWDFFLTV